ncbi:unnamed protein product [Parajaminaea phylloscopi]
MDSKTEWPQSLKDFANRVFSSCSDNNRKAASEELRLVIFEAFQSGTIHSTDWSNVQLKALNGAHSGGTSAGSASRGSSALKGKKRVIAGPSHQSDEEDKKEKRARRFERDQQAFAHDQEQGWSAAIGSTSLGSRFSNLGMSGSGSSNGWTYDAQPTPGVAFSNKHRPMGASGAPYPPGAVGGFDESIADPNVIDWDRDTVVGLSTKLEKPYLRLTSAPDPKTVRPLAILTQTLELLKKKWRAEGNYAYICDQFKSMRQDLTVQRIKNDFTVKVYEIHARIALEKGDLGEYNQCQSQLRTLYAYGLTGNQMEFLAYRILYLLHTRNRREVNALMSELTSASKQAPAVAHALAVRLALATHNYHRFFKLYVEAPNMNAYIMDHFVERERVAALTIIARAYRPSVPLSFLAAELSFADLAEAHEFLHSNAVATYVEPTPAEASTAMSSKSHPPRKKGRAGQDVATPSSIPLEERKWDCKAALLGVLAAGEKYRKVDIKGQI